MVYHVPRNTTKSYAGHQLDIEMLKHVEKMLRIQPVTPTVHANPRIVAGIEKTVQRYAKLFLTDIGSVKTDPLLGNEVLMRVLNGQVSNLAYFDHLCSIANLKAFTTMSLEDADTEKYGNIPDDERIVSSRIVDLKLDYATHRAKVHVFITTAAGDSFTFIIPVSSGITT